MNPFAVFWTTITTPLPPRERGDRQDDLDVARGIGILLVVLGHIVSAQPLLGNDWYLTLQTLIYKFHMPMLMALSGMTFALSFKNLPDLGSALRFSASRAFKLLIPYIAFGLLVFAGKSLAPLFLHVDHPAGGSISDLLTILLFPSGSVANFLWFIYVLEILYLFVPIVLFFTERRLLPLVMLSAVLPLFNWPREFMLQAVVSYLPFFLFGIFF